MASSSRLLLKILYSHHWIKAGKNTLKVFSHKINKRFTFRSKSFVNVNDNEFQRPLPLSTMNITRCFHNDNQQHKHNLYKKPIYYTKICFKHIKTLTIFAKVDNCFSSSEQSRLPKCKCCHVRNKNCFVLFSPDCLGSKSSAEGNQTRIHWIFLKYKTLNCFMLFYQFNA